MGSLQPIVDAEADHVSSFLAGPGINFSTPGEYWQPHPAKVCLWESILSGFQKEKSRLYLGSHVSLRTRVCSVTCQVPRTTAVTQLSLERPLVPCHILLPVPVECEREDWVL